MKSLEHFSWLEIPLSKLAHTIYYYLITPKLITKNFGIRLVQHAMQLVITIFPFTFALALLLLPTTETEALNLQMGKFDLIDGCVCLQSCFIAATLTFELPLFSFHSFVFRFVESWYSQNMGRFQERLEIHSTSGSTTIHLDL